MTRLLLSDEAARRRIIEDVDESLCVEAGAGTGKTTTLVARIVELLRRDRATIDELAVITFTEKAAGELAARLRFELEEAAAMAPEPQECARLDAALLGLHRARVQTIHAFAGDLLRERPVEARLDPGFEVMDDLAAAIDFDAAYQRWLDELLGQSRAEVEIAMRRGFELRHLRQVVEAVHRRRHVLPLRPFEDVPPPDAEGYRIWATTAAGRLAARERSCIDTADHGHRQLSELRPFLEQVARADEPGELERLVLFEAPKITRTAGRQDAWKPADDLREVKEIFREQCERLAPLQSALRCEALCGLLGHAERFVREYEEERRREGRADFDDLLIWARDLVRDDLAARAHFQRRTTRILVDEFQDTDPVQAELVTWICAPPGASGDWRRLVPNPGRLFVVGDPKQSIYRFRGADIAAYDAVKQGPLAGRLERLEQNFRSTASVLDWVNGVFDRVFEAVPGVQPANTHLQARPTALDDGLDRSAIVVVHSDGGWAADGDSAEAQRAEESRLLAQTIARAVEHEHWPVRDPHAGDAVRALRWGDVAILVPSRGRIELLEGALQRYGVPYRLEGGRGFYARQEVRDLIALLAAIDDPTDSIAIVAALRGLAFGCSDDDLLRWRIGCGSFNYRAPCEDGPASAREAMETLRSLHRAQGGLSLGELVRRAVDETGLIEAALTLPGGAQAAANVVKVVETAQAFATAGGGALRAFADWLERMRDEEHDDVDAPVAEERDDVVRVMTIHAAKGLEFPVVCLANLEGRGRNDLPPVADAAERRVHLCVGNDEQGRFQTPGWDDVKDGEKAALEAERDRLLYVAVTRARDHLVVPVCTPAGKEPVALMARLRPSLCDWDPGRAGEDVDGCWLYDATRLGEVRERPPEVLDVAAGEADEELAQAREEFLAELSESLAAASAGLEMVSASSTKSPSRPLVAEADATRGADGDRPAMDTAGAPPLELGDAFHRVMELVDLPDATTLEPLAEAICAEHGIPASADAVVAMARLALEAVRGLAADGETSWHREVPFVAPDGDRVLVGRIDLVLSGERVAVIDYKTDAVEGLDLGEAAERYGQQLEVYGKGVEQALTRVAERYLVLARAGHPIPLSLPDR